MLSGSSGPEILGQTPSYYRVRGDHFSSPPGITSGSLNIYAYNSNLQYLNKCSTLSLCISEPLLVTFAV